MTREQHIEIFKAYADKLHEWPMQRTDTNRQIPPGMSNSLMHAHWMVTQMLSKLEEDTALPGQADRWLGFVQAIFWSNGILSIDELREHNTAAHR